MALEQLQPQETILDRQTLSNSPTMGRAVHGFSAFAETWWRLQQLPVIDRRTPADWQVVGQRLQAVTARWRADSGVTFEVRGARPPAGAVIVANHLDGVDTLVLPSLLPCTCVATSEMVDRPLIGPATRRLGVLFVEGRSALSGAVALRQAMRALDAGVAVIAFPEAIGGGPSRFGRGIFGVARRMGAPVVAVALSAAAGPAGKVVRLSFSAPIDPHDWPNAGALADAARDFIAAQISSRRPSA